MDAQYGVALEALLKAFGRRLKTVVLFGSQARGDARPGSDHDLLIVVDDLPREPLARQREVRGAMLPVLSNLPGSVGLVAKTPAEVDANLTALLLDVCVDGICLYGPDYFEPYRRKALAALKESRLQRQRVGSAGSFWIFPDGTGRDWVLDWDGYRERP